MNTPGQPEDEVLKALVDAAFEFIQHSDIVVSTTHCSRSIHVDKFTQAAHYLLVDEAYQMTVGEFLYAYGPFKCGSLSSNCPEQAQDDEPRRYLKRCILLSGPCQFRPHVEDLRRGDLVLNPFCKQLAISLPQLLQKNAWPFIWLDVATHCLRCTVFIANGNINARCQVRVST